MNGGSSSTDTVPLKGTGPLLWTTRDPTSTRIWEFKTLIEEKYKLKLKDYSSLHQWSITNIPDFWKEVASFTRVNFSSPFKEVISQDAPMFPRPAFFSGARLNFAQNLLYPLCNPPEDSLAVIAVTEATRERVTWKQLRARVTHCTLALQNIGVTQGDRVAGYLGNHTNTLVAMLAATSLGAIWTGVSSDTGISAVLDRVSQIRPKVLFADNAVMYNGKIHEVHSKLQQICKELPQLQAVIIFETIPNHPFNQDEIPVAQGKAIMYDDFIVDHKTSSTKHPVTQLDPDHPVYILYSSGTTGKPKCIVHGAVGTLVQHKKEHDIHCNIRPGDRVFYFTTCTWMMWHWLVSGLASGATIILYDGSPFCPLDTKGNGEMALPNLVDELGITHFGTSAKYLSVLEQKNVSPKDTLTLKTLRAIYSTGSPLSPSTFEYVYHAFGPNINLGSITGGTDIVSLFGAPSLISPVYAGEIQVPGLGMAVEAWDLSGKNTSASNEPGELVCVKPFPCQPVYFWGEEGEKLYKKAYFETFPGVWHHGDYVRFNSETGGMIMLGRSDGVLNPSGVRFGSAEIYNVLLKHFPSVEDALCVGRKRPEDSDEVVILFLKMSPESKYTAELVAKIRSTIRSELSARHVPGIIDECFEIPHTTNGKKVETAVKQILCGIQTKISASVANAECLEWYREWNKEH